MTWYADLSECDYFFSPESARVLRAVGWLERGREYSQGETPGKVYDRLVELLKDPWQPFMLAGPHECSLCSSHRGICGVANLFVPGSGFLYVCPELITHYVDVHGYVPPLDFCRAVLDCPDTQSAEYQGLLLKNGGGVLLGGKS